MAPMILQMRRYFVLTTQFTGIKITAIRLFQASSERWLQSVICGTKQSLTVQRGRQPVVDSALRWRRHHHSYCAVAVAVEAVMTWSTSRSLSCWLCEDQTESTAQDCCGGLGVKVKHESVPGGEECSSIEWYGALGACMHNYNKRSTVLVC